MKQQRIYKLTGVNAIGEPSRITAEVVALTGHNDYFRVVRESADTLRLVTGKSNYLLKKHTALNLYQGIWKDSSNRPRKMHITLKKIVGELHIW